MFAQDEVLTFFPTPVWTFDLGAPQRDSLNTKLLTAIEGLVETRPVLRWGESWQTVQDLQNRPEFSELTTLIGAGVRRALDLLEVSYGAFEITACWGNISAAGAWHRPHRHPNNFLSGVYYVKTQDGADQISFHEPRPQSSMLAPRPKRENAYNSETVLLDAHAGRLVIFPAWLSHSVPPNTSEEERISISFNIVLASFEEDMSSPRWQGNVITDVRTASWRPVS